jgi:hypothetical protein
LIATQAHISEQAIDVIVISLHLIVYLGVQLQRILDKSSKLATGQRLKNKKKSRKNT